MADNKPTQTIDDALDLGQEANDKANEAVTGATNKAMDTGFDTVGKAQDDALSVKFNAGDDDLDYLDDLTDMVANIQGQINGAMEKLADAADNMLSDTEKKVSHAGTDALKAGNDMGGEGASMVTDAVSNPVESLTGGGGDSSPIPNPTDGPKPEPSSGKEEKDDQQKPSADQISKLTEGGPEEGLESMMSPMTGGSQPSSPTEMFNMGSDGPLQGLDASSGAANSEALGSVAEAAPEVLAAT